MVESKKFSTIGIMVMLCIAIIFDIISIIPLLNVFSGIIAWSIFYTIFYFKGISFTKNKQIVATSAVAFVIGLIPGISAVPELTVAVALQIWGINKNASKDQVQESVELRKTRIERVPRVSDGE